MRALQLTSELEIPQELEVALRRMLIHLQKEEFEACHDIIDGLEEESKLPEADREAMNCIASLALDMREINLLEAGGFIYVTDLDGVDMSKLRLLNMGQLERQRIRVVIEEARERLKEQEKQDLVDAIDKTRGDLSRCVSPEQLERLLTQGSER